MTEEGESLEETTNPMVAAPAANAMTRGDEDLKLKAILTWDEFEVSMLTQPNKGRLCLDAYKCFSMMVVDPVTETNVYIPWMSCVPFLEPAVECWGRLGHLEYFVGSNDPIWRVRGSIDGVVDKTTELWGVGDVNEGGKLSFFSDSGDKVLILSVASKPLPSKLLYPFYFCPKSSVYKQWCCQTEGPITIEAEGKMLSAFGPSPTTKVVRSWKGSKRIAKQMNYDLTDYRSSLAFCPFYYCTVCCLYNCGGQCNENGLCAPPTIYQSSLATESPTKVKMDGPCCLMTQIYVGTHQSADALPKAKGPPCLMKCCCPFYTVYSDQGCGTAACVACIPWVGACYVTCCWKPKTKVDQVQPPQTTLQPPPPRPESSAEQSETGTKMAWLATSRSLLHYSDNKLVPYHRKNGPALAMTNRVGICAPCYSFSREMTATKNSPNVTKAQRTEMDEIIRSIGGSRKSTALPWQKRGSYARDQSSGTELASATEKDGVNPGLKRSLSEAEEDEQKLAKLRAGTFVQSKAIRCAIPPESSYEQRVSMIAMGTKNVL
jgi:hypothetical protein